MNNSKDKTSQGAEKHSQNKKLYSILSIVAFVAVMALVCFVVGKPLLRFIDDPAKFRLWVGSPGITGKLIFVGIVVLQVVFALIPGEPIEIGAGYSFGAIAGFILCLIGTALGTVIIYLFMKKIGHRALDIFVSPDSLKRFRFLKKERNIELTVFLLFFIPSTPKDILTYFSGVTGIPLWRFLIITSVARIPSILTSTVGGSALGTKNYTMAIIVFAVTAVVSIGGIFIYNFILDKKNKSDLT